MPLETKVLVIDDERTVRENIAAYLEDSDFSVFQAENGRIGLEIYGEQNPDVVLVDIDMPEMNGLEVLVEIRKISDEIPVVIVSGAGEVNKAIEASRLGAWDFLVKPIHNMSVVEHTIYKVLEHRKLLQENREYKEDLEIKVKERTISLEMRTAELQRTNKKLNAEIDERKLAEARLRQAKERSVAMRRFSNKIAEFNDEARLLATALDELCSNIYLSGAALFYRFKSNQLTRSLPGKPPSRFLNKLPTFEFLLNIFIKRSQEIVVFNTIPKTSKVYDFFVEQPDPPDDIAGGHFAFFRGKALHHHLFVFYRDPLYAPFNNLDIEYMKSMINEINIAYNNIQTMRANSWLERRLKSIIPEDPTVLRVANHPVSGFEVVSSVYPSYEIKAEWHKIIPVNKDVSAILMSDLPGKGLSDIMYSEMASELLVENAVDLADPEKVMEILNAELQTDFHPNRFLTLNYFLIQQCDGFVNYRNLGHESMTLIKFDKRTHMGLEPRKSPFMQVYMDRPGDFFHQENITLAPGEMILGFTQRIDEMIDAECNELNVEDLFDLVRQYFEQPAAEILKSVMGFLVDAFPKELQKDDINLLLIRRIQD
ncbi:response regulator [bacterium]|nr:response regulator [bacterium]